MATLSHDFLRRPSAARTAVPPGCVVSETWTALTISVIWLVVLLDALFGPDVDHEHSRSDLDDGSLGRRRRVLRLPRHAGGREARLRRRTLGLTVRAAGQAAP